MRSTIWVSATVLFFVISCNGQSDKKKDMNSKATDHKVSVSSAKKADLAEISFDTSVDKILGNWGISLTEDKNETTNLNLDYEEFIMDDDKPVDYFKVDLSNKFKDLSIFYDKKNKVVFSYEVTVTEKAAADKLISAFKQKYGKPAFFKEQSSKSGTILFDENGNEVENLKQNFYQWNDAASHTTYFVIEKNDLNIIAVDNRSKRLKEWTSFRSLDMVFPTK